MKPGHQGQVAVSTLIFAQNWEDPAVDEKALEIQQGDTVFTITAGGCNALGFLRFNPAAIYCVDINPAQTYLMELKQSAFRNLSFEMLYAFFGITKSRHRVEIFELLEKDISREALKFWKQNKKIIENGLLMNGRYERFTRLAGFLLRIIQGRKKAEHFFKLRSLQEQKEFYENQWDNKRGRWIFRSLFQNKRLAKKGLDADYSCFDDGLSSYSESFYSRASHVMKNIPAYSNYFLSLYLLGRYPDLFHLPACLQRENFDIIKNNISKIHPVTADSKYWLEAQPDNFFDAMSLSSICELMDDDDTHKLLSEVNRTCRNSGRIVFRNLITSKDIPASLQFNIVKDISLSKLLQQTDRSFVRGKVAAYHIRK